MIARGLLTASLLLVQTGGFDPNSAPGSKKSFVAYVAEPQDIPAARAAKLELRFHVLNGFHVNSHTPHSEFLIPTRLEMQPTDGVKAGAAEFPAGTSYSPRFSPDEKLDVYTDEFTVKLPVAASPGPHEMIGELKYQACDAAACYPPKTLPVKVLFTAK